VGTQENSVHPAQEAQKAAGTVSAHPPWEGWEEGLSVGNDRHDCGRRVSTSAKLLLALVVPVVAIASGGACAPPSFGDEPDVLSKKVEQASLDAGPALRPSADAGLFALPILPADAGHDSAAPKECKEEGAVQAGGHCYFALTAPASWEGALNACAALGAHLATLTSAAEQTTAAALLPTEERWIGLRRPVGSTISDASYAWETGEPRGFANWAASRNEPDGSCPTCNGGVTAECGRLLATGEWADDACTVQHPAICERD
jgi:hypothetical protein